MDSKTIENINPSTTATPTTTVEQVQSSPQQTQTPTQIVNPVREALNADATNKLCVDCKKGKATCISINNGVTLCGECANLHVTFGKGISFVHPIDDEWDTYLLSFLEKGGNAKFVAFCEQNGISSMTPENKYMTRAADYYRRNLKATVLGLGEINKDYAKPEEIIPNPSNAFPEFTNYILPSQSRPKEPEPNPVFGWFRKVSNSVSASAKSLNDKFKATKFGQQLSIAEDKVNQKLKKAGTYIAEKSAPLKESIKKGTTVVGEKVKNAYGGLKTKITKKNKGNENGVELLGSEVGQEGRSDYTKIDININNPDKVEEKKEEPISQPEQPNQPVVPEAEKPAQ